MSISELNSVGHFLIHQLNGVNMNSKELKEPKIRYCNLGYGNQHHLLTKSKCNFTK